MPDEKPTEKKQVRINPVEYAVFCDYASLSHEGKLNLMGIFDRIMAAEAPITHPQMFIVAKMLIPQGKHNITFTLMQQDRVLAKSTFEKEVDKPLALHTHFWGVQNLKIESWDPVELQILLEGKQIFVKRLPVVQAKKKE